METHKRWMCRLLWGASYLGALFGMSFVTMAFARPDSALNHIDTASVRAVVPGTASTVSLNTVKKSNQQSSASGKQPATTAQKQDSQSAYRKGGEKYEQAVSIIKKYEGMHGTRHWPLIGYGHMVQPGEKYRRGVVLSQSEADALLRKDLDKFIALFPDVAPCDALLLGVLSYNIGPGNVKRSNVYSRLKAGNRNIEASYLAHSRYRGKKHSQIYQRRQEELSELFTTLTVTAEPKASASESVKSASVGTVASTVKKSEKNNASADNSRAANNVTRLQ